jgi:hypothetical protein
LNHRGGGWGLVASPVFKTGVTRPRRAGWVRFPHSPAMAFLFLVLLALTPRATMAQVRDSTTLNTAKLDRITDCLPLPVDTTRSVQVPSVIVGPVTRKTGPPPCKVPMSPGSAFLRSFAVPGLAQKKLGRPKAATIFLIGEAGTVGMSIKSLVDLNKAKAARKDTVLTPILNDAGEPVLDSLTKEPTFSSAFKNPNLVGRIRARRTHLEDWIAAAFFNHLFAGADAYVAAHLADFNTNVEANYVDGRFKVLARVAW